MPKIIDRPPRIQPPLPIEIVEIPNPPDTIQQQQALLEALLPLTMVLGYLALAFSGRGGGTLLVFLVPMSLTMIGTVYFSMRRSRQSKVEDKVAKDAYKAKLEVMRNDMRGYHQQQRDYFFYNYPNVNMLRRITNEENFSRTGPRIWERRPEDADFGVVRLGVGTRRSTVTYKVGDSTSTNGVVDPLYDEAVRLAEASLYVNNIPITLALRPTPPIPAPQTESNEQKDDIVQIPRNSLGIYYAGVSGNRPSTDVIYQQNLQRAVYEYSYALLAQFATFHSSIDSQIYIVASSNARRQQVWEWARQLPHCAIGESENHICYEDEKVKTYNDEEIDRLPEFWKDLRKVLQVRQQRMREQGSGDVRFPFILVVVDLLDLPQHSRLLNVETEATVAKIMNEGLELGAAIIFLAPYANKLPSDCQALVELDGLERNQQNGNSEEFDLAFRYAEIEVNSNRYVGQADLMDIDKANAVAYYLSEKMIRFSAAASLPLSFDFLHLNDSADIDDLGYPANWKRSREQGTSWPRVRIGRAVGNEPYELVFSANKSGIHGMIAGTTGSGKSELLLTLIMGLAITYDPSLVNFLLVDYKGGAAFDKFRKLPHCIDIITNLDDTAVERVFASITAELDRRTAIIADHEVSHIVEYREKGYHHKKPLPHLFIIIDEFAEMVADRPEYRAQLDSVTRVGRAIGVHLILATQKPAGVVTDQMRANMKFKVCLRVENPEDSRELLRNTDAAYLPAGIPGRGYAQIGNEIPEVVQVAWANAPYRASKRVSRGRKPIIWDDEDVIAEDDNIIAEEKGQVDIIIQHMDDYARSHRDEVAEQRKTWPDPLPLYLPLEREITTEYLSSEDINYLLKTTADQQLSPEMPLNTATVNWTLGRGEWKLDIWQNDDLILKAPIGLIDHPTQARQLVGVVDFLRDGHLVVFGASGWGKTTAMRTLVVSMASIHSPRDLHIYIMDFGGNALESLRSMPHVGTIITAAEDDRIKQMILILLNMMDERKMVLQGQDLVTYNQRGGGEIFPIVLVVIDNFVELTENYDGLLPDLISILREGRNLGIYFAITAALPNQLGGKIFNLFTNRISLTLSDASEYSTVMGRGGPPFREAWGRGLIGVDREISRNALEVQIAAPVGLDSDEVDELIRQDSERSTAQIEQMLVEELVSEWSTRLKSLIAYMREGLEKVGFDPKVLPRDMKIADKVTLLGLKKNVPDVETLIDQMKVNWERNIKAENAHWPIVEFGMKAGDETVTLEFSSDASGVHGIIAGTTGAGKSELLLSIIVGLAVNYPPSVVNFLLVDFKGGAAFDELRDLPHCIDVVTNLDRAAVERFFATIKAELDRRGEMIAKSKNKHLVEYRKEGKHFKKPFPHLFIIVDEFAEMISDNPEFKPQLDSITRLGRAIGVHLILAAQKPAGLITEQMRANMNFRICLRVKDPEDSRELLRATDAAFIPVDKPGRAFYQVGNQTPEMVQTAFSGAKFSVQGKELFEPIVDRMDANPTLAKILIEYAKLVTEVQPKDFPELPKSWPDPLPRYLPLDYELEKEYLHPDDIQWLAQYHGSKADDTPLNGYVQAWLGGKGEWDKEIWSKPHILKTPIGIADQPIHGIQRLITVDLMKGPVVIFGASGRGKKTFLRSLITGLTANHSPRDLHIYILDFAGHAFDLFDQSENDGVKLPHIGSIINGEETERVNRVMRTLMNMLEERKAIIPTRGEDVVKYNLNRKLNDPHFPAVLVIINNFDEIRENHEQLHQPLISLFREGRSAGIFFAVSGSRYSSLGSKIFSFFPNRATLFQTDPGEYGDLVGRGGPVFREIMGRGLVTVEKAVSNTPLEFQVAAPVGLPAEIYQSLQETQQGLDFDRVLAEQLPNYMLDRLGEYVARQAEAAQDMRRDLAKTIDNLPIYVTYQSLQQIPTSDFSIVLGIEDNDLSQKDLTLDESPHFLILGPPLSGKTSFLQTWILGLTENYSPDQIAIVLIDPRRRLFTDGRIYNLGQLPHVLMTISEEEDLKLFAQKLAVEFLKHPDDDETMRHIFVFADNYEDFSLLDDSEEVRRAVGKLTRAYERSGLHFIVTKSDSESIGNDPLIKQIWQLYRYGFALQNEQSLERLGGRLPRSARQTEMPPGRGYIVRSGQLQLMQTATLIPPDRQEERPKQINNHVQRVMDKWLKRDTVAFQLRSVPLAEVKKKAIDLTARVTVLDSQTGKPAAAPSWLVVKLEKNEEKYRLHLSTKTPNEDGSSQRLIGVLMVHDVLGEVPNLTGDAASTEESRLVVLAENALQVNLSDYENENLGQLKLALSIIKPDEPATIQFSAPDDAYITLTLMEDQYNHWHDDYHPAVEEEEESGKRSAKSTELTDYSDQFGSVEEDYKDLKVDPEIAGTLLPVRGERPPQGVNLDNKYHRLLSASTLKILPDDLLYQIPFEGLAADVDVVAFFQKTPAEVLQQQIDNDEFFLPKNMSGTLWQDIRKIKQEKELV